MVALIPEIFGLGLGMIISPGLIALTIFLLSRGKKGLSHAWAFLLGNILTLAILIIIGFLLGNVISSNQSTSFQNGVDFFIGLLFVFFGIRAIKPGKEKIIGKQKGHFFWFFIGFLGSITNADAETLFLVSMHEIIQCSSSSLETTLLILYCCLMMLLPILLPLVIYYLFPEKSKRVLKKIDEPVKRYGSKIVVFILFLFGVVFLLKGLGLV